MPLADYVGRLVKARFLGCHGERMWVAVTAADEVAGTITGTLRNEPIFPSRYEPPLAFGAVVTVDRERILEVMDEPN